MCEDILYQMRQKDENIEMNDEIYNDTLTMIEDKCLSLNNKQLCQLGLPTVIRRECKEPYMDQYDIKGLNEYVINIIRFLNDSQKIVYETIRKKIVQNDGGIIFMDAPGEQEKHFH